MLKFENFPTISMHSYVKPLFSPSPEQVKFYKTGGVYP